MRPGVQRGLVIGLVGVILPLLSLAATPETGDETRIREAGWDVELSRTASDGLAASAASFGGTSVFGALSVPQCIVRYFGDTRTMYDQLGEAGNIPPQGPIGGTRADGSVERWADYEQSGWPRHGTYHYRVSYRFERDGRFRAGVAIRGPGLEPRARYECLLRIDVDVAGPDGDRFARFIDGRWRIERQETSFVDPGERDDGGAAWVVFSGGGYGYFLHPESETATVTVLRFDEDQGADVLPDISSPAELVRGRPIAGEDVVVWLVLSGVYERPPDCPRAGCAEPGLRLGVVGRPSIGYL